MRMTFGFAGVSVATLLLISSAQATVVNVNQGSEYSPDYDLGGMGNGRAVSFLANKDFRITAIGVDLSVASTDETTYAYQIFASATGQTPGALLASTSFQLSAGDGYRDQAISFGFKAGSNYLVNFQREDGGWLGDNLGTHYGWLDQNGVSAALNYGPFTVIKGLEGASASNYNPLIPYTELSIGAAVPEPATWALMFAGVGVVMQPCAAGPIRLYLL